MNINTSSWHYKLWLQSFADRSLVPHDTDLCRYCHRVFWILAFYGFLAILGAVFVGMCAMMLYFVGAASIAHTGTMAKIIGSIVCAIVPVALYMKWINRSHSEEPKTLIGKWFQARKQKVCPLVEFNSSPK